MTPTLPSRRWLLDQAKDSVAAQTIPCAHLIAEDVDREGPSVLRNRLAASTDTDWLLPLDDDDLLDPDFLRLLSPHCADWDIIYPWCRVEDHGEMEPWTPNRLYRPEPLLNYNFIPITCLIRHSLWDDLGGLPLVNIGEDHRFFRKAVGAGARIKCVAEIAWTYRRGIAGSRNQWVAA